MIHWLCFVFFTLLGVYTHYIVLFILCAENAFFLFNSKKYKVSRRRWCILNAIILILVLPAIKILFLTKYPYGNWWVPRVSWQTIPITLKNFCIGYNASFPFYLFASFLGIALFIYGVIKAKKNDFLWLFIACLFLPLLTVFVFSLIKPSYYIDRHFIPFSVFFYILVAYGISAIKKKYLLFLTLSGLLAFSLVAIKNYYSNYLPNSFTQHIGVQNEKDTRKVAGYIMDNFKAGDMICFSDENAIPQLWYYLGPHYLKSAYKENVLKQMSKNIIMEYDEDKDIISPVTFLKPSSAHSHEQANIVFENYKRIWLITCYNEKGIVKALSRRFMRISGTRFVGVKVYLFLI